MELFHHGPVHTLSIVCCTASSTATLSSVSTHGELDLCGELERETKGSIPFLDVHVKDGSKLTTIVYRKSPHTDCYLHYSSHHHPKVKSGIVDCLHHRAKWICKQDSALADERKHVQSVLMANGYPK